MTCEQETARKLQFTIHDQIASLAEQQSAEIGRVYDSACGGVETLHDLFRLDYEVNLYHFTLYYYDRAGHLVRTVPPAGVRLVSPPSRATVPSHVMVTTYEYNSLGQPIAKNTPDGGTTTFYYDAKQRLRFSQDARQAALYPQRYSYQQYDSLSRVVESGEAMEYTSMYVAVEDFRTLVDTMNYPVRGKTEWTKTTYTTQTGLHYLHDDTSTVRAQRHLRNRVSSRKTYQGVETVYSYDPHGNVAWVYQNLPGLGENFIGYDYDLISNRVKQVLYDEQHGDQFYQRYGYDEDGRVTTVESSRDSVIWDRDAEYSYFLHGPLKRIELGEDRLQGLDYTHTIHGWLKAINHPALSIDTTLDPGHDNGMVRTAPDVFGMILNYYAGDFVRNYGSGAQQSPYNSISVGSSTEQAYQLTSRNLYNGNISGWSLRTTPVGTPSIPAGQTAPALSTHEHLVGYSFRYDVLNRLRTSSFAYYSQGSSSAWNYMGTADYYMSLAYDPNGNIDSMTRHGYAKPGGSVAMDKLTYSYPTTSGSENNRLRHVKDSESSGSYANDIDDEPDDNYLYDPSGNLIYDQSEGTLIRWNAQGKVIQVRKITATVKKDLIYIYDAAGERIAKKELDYLASGDSSWVTYYVRDAGEKVIAVYRKKLHYNGDSIPCPPGVPGSGFDFDADGFDETPPEFCDNCNSTQSPSLPPMYSRRNPWQEDYDNDGIGDACDPCPFGPGDECGTPLSDTAVVPMSKWIPSGFAVLAEWHIYGSSIQGRVGIWKPEKNRDTSLVADAIFTRILTLKEYELKDHLGNVTVVISDLKTATTGGSAPYPFGVDVKSFSHYYPFGMLQPGAFGSNREYRFGFNGKESDNDWKGEGNVYDYGFRVYDPRIAKFLSVDPLAPEYPWYTPYQFAGNMPISMIDRDGLEPVSPLDQVEQEYNGLVNEVNKKAEAVGETVDAISRVFFDHTFVMEATQGFDIGPFNVNLGLTITCNPYDRRKNGIFLTPARNFTSNADIGLDGGTFALGFATDGDYTSTDLGGYFDVHSAGIGGLSIQKEDGVKMTVYMLTINAKEVGRTIVTETPRLSVTTGSSYGIEFFNPHNKLRSQVGGLLEWATFKLYHNPTISDHMAAILSSGTSSMTSTPKSTSHNNRGKVQLNSDLGNALGLGAKARKQVAPNNQNSSNRGRVGGIGGKIHTATEMR